MVSIFAKTGLYQNRVDELVERMASMQGQLDAQQAAISMLFSLLSEEQQEDFSDEAHRKLMDGYPAWLRAADHAINRIPEHHLIEIFMTARTAAHYAIQGVDFVSK